MSDPRVIKRYANRKLYDTQHSCYVTLEQIALMIREGEDVRIPCAKIAHGHLEVEFPQAG